MSNLLERFFNDEFYKLIQKIGFAFLIINIVLFPTFSYLTNIFFLVICNFFEYSTLFFVAYSTIFHILRKDILNSIFRPFCIFAFFILYSLLSTFLTAGFSFLIFKEIIKMITCGCFLYLTLDTVNTSKRVNFLLIAFFFSILIMFASTFIYNINSLENIKEAFVGGKYRFGTKENQSNGYAVYCVLCIFSLILCFIKTRKLYYIFLIIIPAVFCVGTQSKKGIILCFLLIIFSIYKLIEFLIKNKTFRLIVFFASIVLLLTGIVLLSIKLNIFKRFINVLNGTDASTSGRADMFKYAFFDSSKCLFLGHGLGTFSKDFYRYSGTMLTFHSSLGYTFYSSGLVGLTIWICFVVLLFRKNKPKGRYFGLILLFELFLPFNDLTMQIWSQEILFVFTGLFSYLSEISFKERENILSYYSDIAI